MTDREKLIELLSEDFVEYCHVDIIAGHCKIRAITFDVDRFADHLLANGAIFTPAVPGPSDADPNIMELCFHNGERHMKEKSILLLDAFDKDYTCGDPYIEYDALRKAMEDL
jgi:hypothetical protein